MVFAMSGAAAAKTVTPVNLISNGSFEDGTTGRPFGIVNGARFGQLPVSGPSWDVFQAVKGWKTASGSGIEVQTNATLPSIDAKQGSYYLELDGLDNSSISQKVHLGAGSYNLSFWYSPRTNNSASNTIGYSLGNIVSGQVTNSYKGAQVGFWTQIQTRVTIRSGGNYDLILAALGTSDGYGGLIDDVSLTAVPLPAAGLGLLGGLTGLGVLRRRRRK